MGRRRARVNNGGANGVDSIEIVDNISDSNVSGTIGLYPGAVQNIVLNGNILLNDTYDLQVQQIDLDNDNAVDDIFVEVVESDDTWSWTLEIFNDTETNVNDLNSIFSALERALSDDFTTVIENELPILSTSQGLTLSRGKADSISNSLLKVTDPDNSTSELTYTLTQIPANGSLTVGSTVLRFASTFTQADIDNNLITYTHDGSQTASDGFAFVLDDGDGGFIDADNNGFADEIIFGITVASNPVIVLIGTPANETLNGSRGDDILDGKGGNDTLLGKLGNDRLLGGDGNDTLNGAHGDDILDGGNDNDRLWAGNGNDSLEGEEGNDTLNGGNGNDILWAGDGNDILTGGAGNDTLTGSAGNDILTGGAGEDTFQFYSKTQGVDVLRDFASVLDEIRLSAFGFGGGLKKGTTLTNTQFVFGSAAQDSDDRIIYNSGTGALFFDQDGTGSISKIRIATLQNKPTISASDFVIF